MKEKEIKRNNIALWLACLILVAAGCATRQPTQTAYIQPVSFPQDIHIAEEMRITDENDPHQIILFALGLSRRNRHAEAAAFFREAAEKFRSEENELAVSCWAAAANEMLLAGNARDFRVMVEKLKLEMNRFQAAAVNTHAATILALGEIADGAARPSSMAPAGLRDLYDNK